MGFSAKGQNDMLLKDRRTNYAFPMGVPYFGTRVWFTECFDVKSYCFAIWIVC